MPYSNDDVMEAMESLSEKLTVVIDNFPLLETVSACEEMRQEIKKIKTALKRDSGKICGAGGHG